MFFVMSCVLHTSLNSDDTFPTPNETEAWNNIFEDPPYLSVTERLCSIDFKCTIIIIEKENGPDTLSPWPKLDENDEKWWNDMVKYSQAIMWSLIPDSKAPKRGIEVFGGGGKEDLDVWSRAICRIYW